MTFKVGDKVSYKHMTYDENEEDIREGTVANDTIEDGTILVSWVSYRKERKKNCPPVKEKVKSLILFEDAKKEWSKLEKEFNVFSDQIKAKLKEAGNLLEEANALAEKAGTELIYMNGVEPLLRAMEECGWRTSSLVC